MSIMYKNYCDWYFNENLLLQIQNGENDKVRSILQDAKDCHLMACSSGVTLLHFAAKYGNAEISQYLIDLGANVEAENQIKQTPLMYAVEANQLSTVRTLLDANADVLKRDESHGYSANVMRKVIRDRKYREQGKNVTPDEQKIYDNIMMAVVSKVTSSEYFQSIQESDAFHLEYPLQYFIKLGNAEATRILLGKGHPVNLALHEAARRLDLENVKVLLEYNADVNAYDTRAMTPLACIQNFDDQKKTLTVVKALIDAGAMLVDRDRHIILARSILLKGNAEMVETLLQCPIDFRLNSIGYGKTPLWYLAMNKNPNVLEKLRDLRANVFEQSKDELLWIAAEERRTDSIKFLLNCGADANAKSRNNNCSVLRILVRKAVNVQRLVSLNENVLKECLDCIQLFFERGADPQKVELNDVVILPRDERSGDRITPLIEPIFAHLALRETSGQAINQLTRNEIQFSPLLGNIFQANKRHFEIMKAIKIDESVTWLDFLTANSQQIFLYVRNKLLFSNLTKAMETLSFNSYSGRMLNKRFLKFSRLVDWREKTVAVMNEVLSELCVLYINNVAGKIVDYLVHEKYEEIMQDFT